MMIEYIYRDLYIDVVDKYTISPYLLKIHFHSCSTGRGADTSATGEGRPSLFPSTGGRDLVVCLPERRDV